jgi:hypothetical protein
MEGESQISAFISEETKRLLDEQTRETGVKKSFLIEQALRHHLEALRALPADVILPPRLVVSNESYRKIRDAKRRTPKPALKRLMKNGD